MFINIQIRIKQGKKYNLKSKLQNLMEFVKQNINYSFFGYFYCLTFSFHTLWMQLHQQSITKARPKEL